MRENNSERYANTPDSRVPIQGKYARNIREIASAFFRITFRSVKLNRQQWRFDIMLVDADKESVTQFLQQYPMCHIENTFSGLSTRKKSKTLTGTHS